MPELTEDGREISARFGAMPKRWFEDWELSASGWDDGTARLDVFLPHNVPTHYSFYSKKGPEFQSMTNLIDRLLSELTGTKVTKLEVDNGSSKPDIA